MVDEFQKKYESLNVPYPKDTLSTKIDEQAAQQKREYDQFVKDSKTRIEGISEELNKWMSMMPVEEMTLEEAMDHKIIRDVREPSLWPHDEEAFKAWKESIANAKNMKEDDH